MAASTSPESAKKQGGGWLFGPIPDLLFGCGVAWMGVFALNIVDGPAVARAIPGAFLVMIFAVPHYGATLVLVYGSSASRRKYTFFAVYASLLLAVVLAIGVRNSLVGSLILTIYLTWSPWHYTGQNYGVFLTLLGRRAQRPSPLLKRLIYGSFLCSFLLTFLSMHGIDRATYAPVSYAGSVYRLMPIGIPASLSTILLTISALGWVGCTGGAVVGLLRRSSLSAVAPCLVLMATQALWFTVPVAIRQWRIVQGDPSALALYSAYGFIWIAAAHSIQYLWFCTYYATGSSSPGRSIAYLGKAILGGYAIWTLPGVLFAPALLGHYPAEAGLTLMVASVVNLHHFIIDGAIWKLRDNRIARVLLRGQPRDGEASPSDAPDTSPRRFLMTISVLGLLAFGCVVVNHIELEYGFRQALEREDLERADLALTRLKWIGNDSPQRRTQLGRRFARNGDLLRGMEQFQASLALQPTANAWQSIGQLHEQNQRWSEAQRAYQAALEIDPRHVSSLILSGALWVQLNQSDRALPLLERAARIEPDDPRLAIPLRRARRDMGK